MVSTSSSLHRCTDELSKFLSHIHTRCHRTAAINVNISLSNLDDTLFQISVNTARQTRSVKHLGEALLLP